MVVTSMSLADSMEYSSSKVSTRSTLALVRPRWNSRFFATQGPMNTTRARGSRSLIFRPSITMGEGVVDTRGTCSGICRSTKATKAGQQEEVMGPPSRSSNSAASAWAVRSAPRATSATS